jgi:hypothetical protein
MVYEDGKYLFEAVNYQAAERIATALNAQAGVVKALRLCLRAMEVWGLEEVEGFSGEFKLARDALAAVKEVES